MDNENEIMLSLNRLVTLLTFIAIFTMALRYPASHDTWWHLLAGETILDTGQFLWTDPFSHTKADEVWVNHSWLGQLFWVTLFRWGEWLGLGLGLATIVTLAFWWVWLACQGNLYIKTFSLILAAISSSIIWAARPQMLSFLLTALVLYLLHRFKQDGARLLPWLPLIIILWVNLHGGFAIAFILMLCYLVGEAFNLLLPVNQPVHPLLSTNLDQPSSLSWPAWKHLALTFTICLLVVVINPHTWQMWFYPFRTVNIEVLRDFIAEWQSPDFHQPIIQPFLVMLLLLLAAIARSKHQVDWTDLALLGVWLMMSLMAVRHIPIFALIATPILVKHAVKPTGFAAALETHFGPLRLGHLRPPSRMTNLINWFLLGIIVLGPIVQIGGTFSPANLQRAEADRFPVEALTYLREHQPPGPLFNSYNFGGYLMYHLWPDYEIYVDGRTDLYDDMFLRHYLNIILARPGWEIRLAQEQIRLIVIEANAPLALRLTTSTAWQKTYADDQVAIFERHAI